jgi:hypothetical protein
MCMPIPERVRVPFASEPPRSKVRMGFIIAWLTALTLGFGVLALQLAPIHQEQLESIEHIRTLYDSIVEILRHLDIEPGIST